MLWGYNFLIFFIPMLVILAIYLLLPKLRTSKEVFGYKINNPIEEDVFNQIKKDYYKKIIFFSVPFMFIVSIISILIDSYLFGLLLLVLSILSFTALNFFFYMQAYKQVKLSEKNQYE